MAFQPFGYRFDVASTKSPAEAKAALRKGMRGWFDGKNGPRGWIVGPFICLWLSAFDRYGPMLFGRISHGNFGARVQGRAGSDLNGVATFSLLIPLMALLVYALLKEQPTPVGLLLWMAGLVLIGGPLVYWIAHKDRREAEPLVNFVRRALGETLPAPRLRVPIHRGPYLVMDLTLNGERLAGNATPNAIQCAVEAIRDDDDGFVILSQADQVYMQVALSHGQFLLEKREGSGKAHFAARKEGGDPFTPDEIVAVLANYLAGEPDIPGVHWDAARL